jgi:hypothetical protein
VDLAIEIVESEIRSAMYELWLEAAKLVLGRGADRGRATHAGAGPTNDPANTLRPAYWDLGKI